MENIQGYTKRRMRELGLNQNQLAKKLGVSRVSVWQFLHGERTVSPAKIFAVLGTPDLLTDCTDPMFAKELGELV